MRIACTTYGWTDETPSGNFKLAFSDTLDVDNSSWTSIEPEFMKHFNVKTSTVDNLSDLTKLKHEEKDNSSDLMIEITKLINNVGSTSQSFTIPVQANSTEAEVTKLVIDSNKNHLMKTIFSNGFYQAPHRAH